MRINVAIPEAHVKKPVLDAALEATTRLNEQMLAAGEIPTFDKALAYGVKWRPEPPGDEHFDHGKRVMARKWGDCDDLAPWHAATLRHTGEDPGAQAIVKRTGPKLWHAVVQRSNGSIDDPSKRAGMGSSRGVVGAALPLMYPMAHGVSGAYIVRPQIAVRPIRGGWQARTDLPWHNHDTDQRQPPTPTDYMMTMLHAAPTAHTALTGCIAGACRFAEAAGFSTDDHLDRIAAIADACEGVDHDELASIYGEEHAEVACQVVGSMFGFLKKAARGIIHNPLTRAATSFIPGGSLVHDAARYVIPAGSHPGTAAVVVPPARPRPHEGRICFPATFE
jgi:hypothetical protein